MRIKDISCENRPRERLKRHGVEVLSDAELLGVLLENGFKDENAVDLGNRVLKEAGLSCGLRQLMKVKGVGLAKASKILAALELGRRFRAGSIN